MDFTFELKSRIEHVNKILRDNLPECDKSFCNIEEAMEYSVMAGGKRLRGILLLEAFKLFQSDEYVEEKIAYPFAAAIEFIHTYSLVHDDLPAMDNDMMRRGKPTTHAAYGEAMGILAGDALLNYAAETAVKAFSNLQDIKSDYLLVITKRVARAIAILFEKSGIKGMIGGQVLDINGIDAEESKDEILEKLTLIYELKTSALFQAALMAGGALGGAEEDKLQLLSKLGYHLGVAFQIKDDILDMTSTVEELGKDVGNDEKNNKLTYASTAGLKEAAETAQKHAETAVELAEKLGSDNAFLTELIKFLVNRNN